MAEPGPIHPCAKWRHFKQHFDSLTGQLTGIETPRWSEYTCVYPAPVMRPDIMFEVPRKSDTGSIRCHLCAFESNLEGWFVDHAEEAEEEDEELEVFDV
jgi:hypothetical protein